MKADKNVFPYKLCRGDGSATVYTGLTARDYIATQAMVGILASSRVLPSGREQAIADLAYKQADAMIERSEAHE